MSFNITKQLVITTINCKHTKADFQSHRLWFNIPILCLSFVVADIGKLSMEVPPFMSVSIVLVFKSFKTTIIGARENHEFKPYCKSWVLKKESLKGCFVTLSNFKIFVCGNPISTYPEDRLTIEPRLNTNASRCKGVVILFHLSTMITCSSLKNFSS